MKNKKILAALVLVLALTCAGGAFLLTSCSSSEQAATEEEVIPPEPEPILNPLTGEDAEAGFNEKAADRRIVAFVVENTPDARPQWGMDDEKYSPDMILQAEVEGGITRTLWFYADYKKLPEQIGPMRSARPPFIRFSECFDSIFIHWGMSHSKGDYVGASSIFNWDEVDHINQMGFSDEAGMFGRDSSRGVSAEHTGIVHGDAVPAAIKEYGCRTTPNEFTKLKFNETAQPMSDICADEVRLDFSDRTDWETTVWTYNEEDKQYHTDNFNNNLKRDNLLVLFSDTEYITKEGYQGPGSTGSVTYCNYKLAGGKGKLFSQGTVKNIKWRVNDYKLTLIDMDATKAARKKAAEEAAAQGKTEEEIKALKQTIEVEASLNVGKTWIGWASANNGGDLDIIPNEPKQEEEATDENGNPVETEATEESSEAAE